MRSVCRRASLFSFLEDALAFPALFCSV